MPTLPWATPAAGDPDHVPDALVMASRFVLKRWRDVPRFLIAALQIRRQMLRSAGVVGVSLIAQPQRKTFYTLSAWRDRRALDLAVANQPHAATMATFKTKMAKSSFRFWHLTDGLRPDWPDAFRRLDEADSVRAVDDDARTL